MVQKWMSVVVCLNTIASVRKEKRWSTVNFFDSSPTIMAGSDRIAAEMDPSKGSPEVIEKHDVSQIERVLSGDSEIQKGLVNYGRVDEDVAKYAAVGPVNISEADNRRLKRMIDIRVLAIMVPTYFLQALDKGTMSFASIMGIKEDLHLHGQQVK